MLARHFFGVYHTLLAPNKADSVQLLSKHCSVWSVSLLDPARHVGYMEQHPGAQEAAGLSAGEAAAAAERPGAAVRGYVHTRERAPAANHCFCYHVINGVFIRSIG